MHTRPHTHTHTHYTPVLFGKGGLYGPTHTKHGSGKRYAREYAIQGDGRDIARQVFAETTGAIYTSARIVMPGKFHHCSGHWNR